MQIVAQDNTWSDLEYARAALWDAVKRARGCETHSETQHETL